MCWIMTYIVAPLFVMVIGGLIRSYFINRRRAQNVSETSKELPPCESKAPSPSQPLVRPQADVPRITTLLTRDEIDRFIAFQKSPRLDKELTLKIKRLTIGHAGKSETHENVIGVVRKVSPNPVYYVIDLDDVPVITSPTKMNVVELSPGQTTISNADQACPFTLEIAMSTIARITLRAFTEQKFAVNELLEWAELLKGLSSAKTLVLRDPGNDSRRIDFSLEKAVDRGLFRKAAKMIKPHLQLYEAARNLQASYLTGVSEFPVLFSDKDARTLLRLQELQCTGRVRVAARDLSTSISLLPEWRSLSGVLRLMKDSTLLLRNESYQEQEGFLGRYVVSYSGIEIYVASAKVRRPIIKAATILLSRRLDHHFVFHPKDGCVFVRYAEVRVE